MNMLQSLKQLAFASMIMPDIDATQSKISVSKGIQLSPKVWAKRKKRIAMQKASRRINRK